MDALLFFSGEPVLKAVIMQEITVPAYTRKDGTFVPQHRKRVHVSTDRSKTDIANGRGSASQREAHALLRRHVRGFDDMHEDDRHALVLAHATDIQMRRSHAAAISQWRAAVRAGRNPTAAQWRAFAQLSEARKNALLADAPDSIRAAAARAGDAPVVMMIDGRPVDAGRRRAASQSAAQSGGAQAVAQEFLAAPAAAPDSPEQVAAMKAAMSAVPLPAQASYWEDSRRNRGLSPTNQYCLRRIGLLREMAERGDYDGVANFSTSRSRANYRVVDDYRLALLAAAASVRQGPAAPAADPVPAASPAPAQADAPAQTAAASVASSGLPAAPVLTGRNPNNSALRSAQRKIEALRAAAESADPVSALLEIRTSRGNSYINAADDYRTALLRHFGYDVAGRVLPDATAASGRRRRASAAAAQAAQPDAAAGDASGAASSGRLARLDPAFAAILPGDDVSFHPRPNVPLDWRVRRTYFEVPGVGRVPWPNETLREIAHLYLSQTVDVQREARAYQRQRVQELRQTHQSVIDAVAAVRERRQQELDSRAAAERQANEEQRAAASNFIDNLLAQPDIFKPRSPLGGNIMKISGDLQAAGSTVGLSKEDMTRLVQTMIVDYVGDVKFDVTVSPQGAGFLVYFVGSDGTRIRREFRRGLFGELFVSHALFEAGTKGAGSAKALFRTSLGVYRSLGVKKVIVYANIDVGGYAWAKFGFLPDRNGWDRLRKRVRRKLASSDFSPEIKDRVNALLENDDPRSLWVLSDLKAGDQNVGKELLLGTDWWGELPLDESADQYRRCIAYITEVRS